MNDQLSFRKEKIQLQDAISSSLAFFERQNHTDFEEANHIMKFPWWAGFRSFPSTHVGNIFQLTIIANALLKAKNCGFVVNSDMIKNLVERILIQKDISDNGWKYFPRLKELPPDTDDLAQVIQVFKEYDSALIKEHCAGFIDFVIKNCTNKDGSIDTWIYSQGSGLKKDKVYERCTRKYWGSEPDPEVVANFLYSLFLIDEIIYREIISNGSAYLKKKMHPDFYWPSTWYWGKSYGTYVCTRMLSRLNGNHDLLRSVGEAIIYESAGPGRFINPLEESFNLLALLNISKIVPLPADEILKSLGYLLSCQEQGHWEAIPFIRMNRKRTSGGESYLSFKSSIITSSYCLYALVSCIYLLSEAQD